MSNSSGTVAKSYEYDAFGNEKNPVSTDANPWRYCGEYFDKETGTYHMRARNYDPRIGRFTSQDPIKDGLNWYTYCGNNPVRYIDPSGLAPTPEQQKRIDSAYQAYIGCILPYEQYAANVILNGGIPVPRPTPLYSGIDEVDRTPTELTPDQKARFDEIVDRLSRIDFPSERAAADAFAAEFAKFSIEINVEFGANIIYNDITKRFYLRDFAHGNSNLVDVPWPTLSDEERYAATAHAHGAFNYERVIDGVNWNDRFSYDLFLLDTLGGWGDLGVARARQVNSYVCTPGGLLLYYDYEENQKYIMEKRRNKIEIKPYDNSPLAKPTKIV